MTAKSITRIMRRRTRTIRTSRSAMCRRWRRCNSSSRSYFRTTSASKCGSCRPLLGDFALGFVGGVVDLGLEAFEQTLQEGIGVGALILKLVGVGDVPGEVGEDDAPGEGVLPGATADADVLALLGDPDPHDFEGRFVALRYWWTAQSFFGAHLHPCPTRFAVVTLAYNGCGLCV